MKQDPSKTREMHGGNQMGVPQVPIKDTRLSDIYHEIRIIRRWVVFIGIVLVVVLVGVIVSLFLPV